MAESDQYYIQQCLNGHPDEFRCLIRRHQTSLLVYLAGKLGNKAGAEEAAQETFVRAYFGLNELKKRQSFYSWLFGIAGRVAKEQLRNQARHGMVDGAPEQTAAAKPAEDYQLEQAIAQLPDSYRELILLRFYGGQSCRKIAEKLDMPVGTVTKQLSRAYAKLRQFLSDEKEVQK